MLTLCSLQIPFFWDTILFSKISHWYIDTGFSSLLLPEKLDTGNQPFFCLLLALCWKVFGKTLVVSHLIMLPFLIGIVYQYWLLIKRFVDSHYYWLAVLLFVLEPTLMAQSTQVIIDIPLLFLYLLGLNAILNNKTSILIIATVGLSLTNLRGCVAIGALFLTQTYLNGTSIKAYIKTLKYYIPSAICIISWLAYHKTQSGWTFVQPDQWAEHRQILNYTGMLKNLLFIAWRFADFGRLIPYLILTIIIARKLYKRTLNQQENQLIVLILIPTLIFSLFFMPFSNPIGHRYYLISYVLLLPLLTIALTTLKPLYKNISIAFISISLLIGPFIIYSNPYTNGWDSTIAHLRYFKLRKEMSAFIDEQKINAIAVGATFPHHAGFKYTDLEETHVGYTNRGYASIDDFQYILYSNISNSFTSKEIQELKQNWVLVKQMDNWPVSMILYKKN